MSINDQGSVGTRGKQGEGYGGFVTKRGKNTGTKNLTPMEKRTREKSIPRLIEEKRGREHPSPKTSGHVGDSDP